MIIGEQWAAIAGYDGLYEVSSFGRVKSMRKGRVMSPGSGKDGYPIVSLYGPNGRKGVAVHRLVAETFVPGRTETKNEVAHLDGSRTNSAANNLKWVDRSENLAHREDHGTLLRGETHPLSKISEKTARHILANKGRTCAASLAKRFRISRHAIYDIWQGKRWTHIASNPANADAPTPNRHPNGNSNV